MGCVCVVDKNSKIKKTFTINVNEIEEEIDQKLTGQEEGDQQNGII